VNVSRHPRLQGLLACLALAGLLVGLPAVLLALGWGRVPASPAEWMQRLTSPDDGTFVLLVVKAAAWVTWLVLAASIVTEIVAAVRGISAPTLPGLRWSQTPARQLVGAATLLFVALPTIAGTVANAAPAAATPQVAAQSPKVERADVSVRPAIALAEERPTHTVKLGDSLWSIAEQHLGSGHRYAEIAGLNADLLDGHDDFLRPGWVLTLPAHDEGTYTVRPGDTLSGIAREQLDDETQWPAIFAASRHTTQPDGGQLTDPDLILPGWTLTLPAPLAAAPEKLPVEPTSPPLDEAQGPTSVSEPPSAPEAVVPSVAVPPTSADAAGSAPLPAPTSAGASTVSAEVNPTPIPASTPERDETAVPSPWLLAGLTGAGALLAGGLFTALRRRREAQFRARRPGRTIAAPGPELAPVERTIIVAGSEASPTLAQVDQALRRLADVMVADDRAVPELAAVRLASDRLTVHLVEPVDLPAPWQPTDDNSDGRRWSLNLNADATPVAGRAPYPQLVSVGRDDEGATWLVNLEQLGTVSLTGDPAHADDFARYLAAEIAVNPWSRDVRLDCIGVCAELVDLDPARIQHHRLDDPQPSAHADPAALALGHAAETVDRASLTSASLNTGRSGDAGDEVWTSRLLLVNGTLSTQPLDQLLSFIAAHPAASGTAVVLVGDGEPIRGTGVRLTSQGRVQLPTLGLDLAAVGLTMDEAAGCALLMAHADQLDDVPMPTDGDEGWREQCDAAGALRPDLVVPRSTDAASLDEPAASTLGAADEEILAVSAATPEDLEQLAPLVPAHVRDRVEAVDDTLDADVAAWLDPKCVRPRLSLLGPIHARVGPSSQPKAVLKRRAFYAELLTFLALHPHGVTTDQLVTAFGGGASEIRKHLTIVRVWLGVDPATGQRFLPEANQSPAAKVRGTAVYQLVGVLVDFDLFRRLRARGQARGADGLPDLRQALELVEGEPLTAQRRTGWGWLADGVRFDQHMVCGIVDVAHLVTMAALTAGDLRAARAATEVAIAAAPFEDTPQMDLAAILRAEGDLAAAHRVLIDAVANRSEDGEAPADLADRTAQILDDPSWSKRTDQVA